MARKTTSARVSSDLPVDGFDSEGRRVKETYYLDSRNLLDILMVIDSADASDRDAHFVLRADGIDIFGLYDSGHGSYLSAPVAHLVEGSRIGRKPRRLYLQTFEYKFHLSQPVTPNVPKLLRRFIRNAQ